MEKENIGQAQNQCEIWAVGGAKGGTGKSFISSSTAIHLAQSEKKVTLIDMDIGGANLHSYLGIKPPKKNLTNFFEGGAPLADLKTNSGIKNLSFIAGDVDSLSSGKILYFQKIKLFKHIRSLDSEVVVLDMGPGSHSIFIDTFLLADKKISVLLPEVLSVENLYHFIKNVLFRKLRHSLRQVGLEEFVEMVWNRREEYRIKNFWELITWLKNDFPFLEEILRASLSDFKINIILNKVRNYEDIILGSFIKSGFMRFLELDISYLGFVEYDEDVITAYKQKEPFLKFAPLSSTTDEIRSCVDNLIQGKEQEI